MNNLMSFIDSFNVFNLIFWIVLGIYLWYTFSIIYHLIRFGVGAKPKILGLVFFVVSFFLFTLTLDAYSKVDWKAIIEMISKLNF
jgi:hypothetical protein